MRVCLYLDRARTLRWHQWLSQGLTISGHEVCVRFSPNAIALPNAYYTLFALERAIFIVKGDNAADPIHLSVLPSTPAVEPFDVLINFTADAVVLPAKRVLTPLFNTMPTVFGALAALLSNETPRIEIHDTGRSVPHSAHPALKDREVLIHGLDNVLSCAVGLLLKTLETPVECAGSAVGTHSVVPTVLGQAYAHMVASVIKKVGRLAGIKARGRCDWYIGWRYGSVSLIDSGRASFRVLQSEKGHYYGDPFPFRYEGCDFIFFEDFDCATGYARIAVCEISEKGASAPRPVLDSGYHLSYPFIFAYDNQIWMIPESGDVHELYLYRAVKFPYEWKCDGILIHGVGGYDATLLLPQLPAAKGEEQRIWLFVTERMWHSTGWDAFSLFHSDSLFDPNWIPHAAGNPIVFDSRLSRSAGKFFRHKGHLIRPVQDCSELYGGAVNLCQIDTLNSEHYEQHVIGTIHCAPAAGKPLYQGCHTYNYSDGLEVIDIFDRDVAREVTAFYQPATSVPVLEKPRRRFQEPVVPAKAVTR